MPEIKQLFASPRCQHVHYSGKPCKAPARRGRNYCVFHQAAHLDPGGCVLPIVEDLHSYHLAIIRIARALADDVIDARKATALLYAMQLAGWKLDDFSRQRAELENPATALRNEIAERYDARQRTFPSYIPEKDLLVILKEMRAEQISEKRHDETEPDIVEVIPQPREAEVPSGPTENSPAVHCRVTGAPIAPSAVGTTEISNGDSSVPTGRDDQNKRAPGVETPGYFPDVPPGRPIASTNQDCEPQQGAA